jgi:hypothetical protein
VRSLSSGGTRGPTRAPTKGADNGGSVASSLGGGWSSATRATWPLPTLACIGAWRRPRSKRPGSLSMWSANPAKGTGSRSATEAAALTDADGTSQRRAARARRRMLVTEGPLSGRVRTVRAHRTPLRGLRFAHRSRRWITSTVRPERSRMSPHRSGCRPSRCARTAGGGTSRLVPAARAPLGCVGGVCQAAEQRTGSHGMT